MNRSEKEMWETNIENSASVVATEYGEAVVSAVYHRYGANHLSDLHWSNYSEVFADLEQIIHDN